MSKPLGFALVPFLLLGLPAAAHAQPEPEPEPEAAAEDPAATDKVELEEEAAPEEDTYDFDSNDAGDENPDDPNSAFNQQEADDAPKKKVEKKKDGAYPARVIDRPITLPGGMSEISLGLPVFVDPFSAGATLRGNYGITSEVQIGLRYGMGAFSEDGFEVGKAVSIDAQYLFTDNISAQLSIPMFLDPFALGVVLGAPMKFTFFDSFSLVFGQDLISIKVHEFFPSIDNAAANAGAIALRESNTTVPLWLGNASLRAIYQMNDKMALDAQFGTIFDDTATTESSVQFNVGVLHAHTNKLDFGARLGATDLSLFVESLSINLFANLRI
jgi:hypothetical protein